MAATRSMCLRAGMMISYKDCLLTSLVSFMDGIFVVLIDNSLCKRIHSPDHFFIRDSPVRSVLRSRS